MFIISTAKVRQINDTTKYFVLKNVKGSIFFLCVYPLSKHQQILIHLVLISLRLNNPDGSENVLSSRFSRIKNNHPR